VRLEGVDPDLEALADSEEVAGLYQHLAPENEASRAARVSGRDLIRREEGV
jgi:hypothetical protein